VCLVAPKEIQLDMEVSRSLKQIVIPSLGDSGLKRHWNAFKIYGDALDSLAGWNATHVHFLYGDWNMLAITAALSRSNCGGRKIVTGHWASGVGLGRSASGLSSAKKWFHRVPTRQFVASGGAFVVHDDGFERTLRRAMSQVDVKTVPYPVFPLKVAAKEKSREYRRRLGIDEGCQVLLCFGDTRYDKGVDLALTALSRLPTNYHLLIAGRSSYFDSKDIHKLAEREGISSRVHYIEGYVPEDDVGTCFGASDFVLLPYRRGFSGQSGPLTLGAALGKPIIGARLPVIANTISRYSLGALFEPEDVDDMVRAIRGWNQGVFHARQYEFQRKHSCEAFVTAMKKVYCADFLSTSSSAK